jgi:hypothetical protein
MPLSAPKRTISWERSPASAIVWDSPRSIFPPANSAPRSFKARTQRGAFRKNCRSCGQRNCCMPRQRRCSRAPAPGTAAPPDTPKLLWMTGCLRQTMPSRCSKIILVCFRSRDLDWPASRRRPRPPEPFCIMCAPPSAEPWSTSIGLVSMSGRTAWCSTQSRFATWN